MGKARSFLFLQGVCSPFFARLANRLTADGHHVHKINFNGGDTVYWGARGAGFFCDKADALPEFFGEIHRKFGITDQLLFGDCDQSIVLPLISPGNPACGRMSLRRGISARAGLRWSVKALTGIRCCRAMPTDYLEPVLYLLCSKTKKAKIPWLLALHLERFALRCKVGCAPRTGALATVSVRGAHPTVICNPL